MAESVGLRGVRLHDLRHAHATILLQQGIHPKIVQGRLGHSSVSTTLDIYSYVLSGLQEAAARRLDEGLKGTPNEVIQENVGKIAMRCSFEGEFETILRKNTRNGILSFLFYYPSHPNSMVALSELTGLIPRNSIR